METHTSCCIELTYLPEQGDEIEGDQHGVGMTMYACTQLQCTGIQLLQEGRKESTSSQWVNADLNSA
jgi:hypothetical protein